MKLDRLPYSPAALVDFFEESLATQGALCERTWHDRLDIVAEGQAARLWNADGSLHQIELTFASADATSARDAAREVFPGCPLTFRLAENLRPAPLSLDRIVLKTENHPRPPDASVAEKLWRAQFPDTTRWRLDAAFAPDFHFALLALVRCEIQAIDQHWSAHRLAISLSDGAQDKPLAQEFSFAQADPQTAEGIIWPAPAPARWKGFLHVALEADLAGDLASIRQRQENYLRRELDRISEYFDHYEKELTTRAARSSSQNAKLKTNERLAAAKAEHSRRRADQVARHEIRIHPHLDALLLVAEPAWRAILQVERAHSLQATQGLFVPRARKWFAP